MIFAIVSKVNNLRENGPLEALEVVEVNPENTKRFLAGEWNNILYPGLNRHNAIIEVARLIAKFQDKDYERIEDPAKRQRFMMKALEIFPILREGMGT